MELATSRPGLVLRELSASDAPRFWEVLHANAAHVNRLGDHDAELRETIDGFAARFSDPTDRSLRLGIFLDDDLVGHVAVLHREPPTFGLGYWLAEAATGRGVATAAVRAALAHAHAVMGAEEVLAGVTIGNARSVALLLRIGFRRVAEFETYARYRVVLPAVRGSSGGVEATREQPVEERWRPAARDER